MSNDGGVDTSRRRFLTVATAAVGGVGAVFGAYPFLAAMQPSARAEAAGAPVEVDISKLEPGARLTVEWRGKPVWVVRRTPEMLSRLDGLGGELRDPNSDQDQQPNYAKNTYRSIKPEILVLVGICTHLGCSPTYRPEPGAGDLGSNWPGGFFCPCHGSRFDMAGRVFAGVPAPLNMAVPPYRFAGETRVVIGDDKGAA
ncbi:MAG TPA: ubiquinol-cytochrome c reductase iron-sulfur subunit [Candidatus Macondimonas sp.]|nr:ubiquinol-cytochrome c reductase iron-sulfur subunit [Candidatus Macondimonas sp.]